MPSYKEIQDQITKLQAQAEKLRSAEREAAIADVKAKIAEFALTAKEIGLGSSGSRRTTKAPAKPAVKYKHGDLTWSGGRGPKPKWVKELINAGKDIEKYRV